MDPDEHRAALSQQLISAEQELERQIVLRIGLSGLGPIRFRASSGWITIGYIIFNLACLAVGFVLITYPGTPRDIGIAVVAGAIFAFGAFAAQWWAVLVQRELSIRDAANRESDAALWHELYLNKVGIEVQIKALDTARQGQGSSPNLITEEPRLEGPGQKTSPSEPT
jgi:hypothetical protein